jgi:hypothetical protein
VFFKPFQHSKRAAHRASRLRGLVANLFSLSF